METNDRFSFMFNMLKDSIKLFWKTYAPILFFLHL